MSERMQKCLEYGRKCLKQLRKSGLYDPLVHRGTPTQVVSEFLASKQRDRGYLIIVAEPDIGKTGFMLNLSNNAAISYFFQDRDWCANILNFLNYLAAELHRRLTKDMPLPRYLVNADDARRRVDSLLDKAGRSLGKDEKLLIVVDALDEADLGDTRNAYLLKFNLPRGVYFVCASKHEPRILDQLATHPDVSLFDWPKDKPTIAEVADYIERCLPQTCTTLEKQSLSASADGNFRLAWFLLDEWKRGTLSLEKIPAEPRTLYRFYQVQWQNSILAKTRMPELCEDVATLLAAARRPLSASIITGAIRHQGVGKLKARNVEKSLTDIATRTKLVAREGINRWGPCDASFGRWLEEFYAGDLCQAHRALAMALIDVLKSNSNPDFEYAAQYACWHLRQWANKTTDTSQKRQAREILRKLIDNSKVREEVERRAGTNAYLEHFLHEAVKCSEQLGSFPDLVRFGTRYLDCRQRAKTNLNRLGKLLEGNRFSEAMDAVKTLPTDSEVLAGLAFVGCQAVDEDHYDLLPQILDYIEGDYGKGFGPFAPMAWSLVKRLVGSKKRDLAIRLLAVLSEDEYKHTSIFYFREILQAETEPSAKLDLIGLFLNKVRRFDISLFRTNVNAIAQLAFDSGLDNDEVAECLLAFLHSLQDAGLKEYIGQDLSNLFIDRGLSSKAADALHVLVTAEVIQRRFTDVIDIVATAVNVLQKLEDKRSGTVLYIRLLKIIEAFKELTAVCKADVLGRIARGLWNYPLNQKTRKLAHRINATLDALDQSFFKDYAHVQLAGLFCQHRLYDDAVRQKDLIEDALCKIWAEALIAGQAGVQGSGPASTTIKDQVQLGDKNLVPPTSQLLGMAKELLRVAAQSVSPSCSPRLRILDMSNSAITDIVWLLHKTGQVARGNTEIVFQLLVQAVNLNKGTLSDWDFLKHYHYNTLILLVKLAHRTLTRRKWRHFLSTVLADADGNCCANFLQNLAIILTEWGEKEFLGQLVEKLIRIRFDKPGFLQTALGILATARAIIDPMQLSKVTEHLVDTIDRYETIHMSWTATQLIKSIPSIVDSHRAVKLLARLTDIYKEEGSYAEAAHAAHVVIADCYVQLGLWGEAKRCAEHCRSSCGAAVLSHVAFCLDKNGQLAEGNQAFIKALKIYGDTHLAQVLSQMYGSYTIGCARAGGFRQALEQLQNARKPSYVPRVLVEICRCGNPSAKESVNFVTERVLIENILGTFVGQRDLVKGLTAKAHFLRKAGCEEEADEIIQRALAIVANQYSKVGGPAGHELAEAAKSLGGLLVQGGNQQLLQDWLQMVDRIVCNTDCLVLLSDVVGALTANIIEEKPWLVSKVINIIRRNGFRTSKSAKYLSKLAELISRIQSEKLSWEYWKQLIGAFSHLREISVKGVGPSLCSCLARSSIGGQKKRFLRELCVAAAAKGRTRISDTFRGDTLREVIRAFAKSKGFQDKKAILREMLVDGWFSGQTFVLIDAVIAQGFAFLGDKEEAKSLFEKAMDSTAGFQPEHAQVVAKSDVLSLMAECGFKEETLPTLRILGKGGGSGSDLVKKNTAISLLYCDEREAASTVVSSITDEFIRVVTLLELFECNVRKFVHIVSENGLRLKADGGEKSKNQKAILHDVKKYLAMVDETRDVCVRDDALQIISNTVSLLPTEEAFRWLVRLPHFTDEHKSWENACAANNYSPDVIKGLLEVVPHRVSKSLFIRSLSSLQDERITDKVRLLLCAAAVVDEKGFVDVVCDTLENCTNAEILEQVKQEIDQIDGIKAVEDVEEAPETTEAAVAEAKDEEPLGHDKLEIRFKAKAKEDKPRVILVNGQSPSKQPAEGLFVYVLSLAAGRRKNKRLDKTADLLFNPLSSEGDVILHEIRDFFDNPSFGLKGKVHRRDWVRSVKGEVSLELFDKEGINIDHSLRWFESEYMIGLEEMVEKKLQAAKISKLEKSLGHRDNFPALDDLELEDGKTYGYEVAVKEAQHLEGQLKRKIRRTFRYTRIVMRALEIMKRKFQDDAWWEKWNRLQEKCYKLLLLMDYNPKKIEQDFYLPRQRGHQ